MDRRDFLNSLGRYTCLGILAGVSAVVVRRAGNQSAGNCSGNDLCTRCNLLAGCELPDAVKEKRERTVHDS